MHMVDLDDPQYLYPSGVYFQAQTFNPIVLALSSPQSSSSPCFPHQSSQCWPIFRVEERVACMRTSNDPPGADVSVFGLRSGSVDSLLGVIIGGVSLGSL